MVVISEVPTPQWIKQRGFDGPVYLITRVPGWQAALLLCIPGLILAGVAATSGFQAFVIVVAIDAVIIAAGAFATSQFRFLAGQGWLASENVLRRRLVRLDCLVKADVYTSKTTTYLRLHDKQGGSVALTVGAVLPRVRDQVIPAVSRAQRDGLLEVDARTARTIGGIEEGGS